MKAVYFKNINSLEVYLRHELFLVTDPFSRGSRKLFRLVIFMPEKNLSKVMVPKHIPVLGSGTSKVC